MWLTLGLDLSKPCRWSQVCLEQAYLVVVKDAVKFGLTDGPDLLQGVTSSIAVVCTEAQVHICSVIQNPQLYAPVVNPIAQHERMQAIRKVLLPSSCSLWHALHRLTPSTQVLPPHPRQCKVGGVSKKWGNRMPRGGTSGHGYGASNFVSTCTEYDIMYYNKHKVDALACQMAVYNLFPRAITSLLAHNFSLDLHLADSHATNGQSDVGVMSGLSHVHITGKTNPSKVAYSWHCKFHVDDDASQHEHTYGPDSERDAGTNTLGIWWPANIDPARDTVRFVFECCGYLPLDKPIAIQWNSRMSHGSYSTFLPAGVDVVGTSTESALRAVQHRLKHTRT